ncbi:MAG TPA: hypothetical protein VMT62_07340, partial [Syntrophorhabdaceae bacterium]|nr:hypothetical protein [Syntrophorhabdaceae bacterium]
VWHPSVHQQTFDVKKTSTYIGIDISSCFTPVKRHTFHFYGRVSETHMPKNSILCEKGPRSSSVESFLFSEAKDQGVEFFFGETFDLKTANLKSKDGHKCIVATGLEETPYETLDIKHVNVQGFRGSGAAPESGTVLSFFGDYTNHDFAYLASLDDLMFCLLFSRIGVNEHNLKTFNRHLFESTGIALDDWRFSTGCVPLERNLAKEGMVLAGTISGMIDPFFLNGISAALISGKIAAEYFISPERALREFSLFTRTFSIRRFLKSASKHIPLKRISFPVMVYITGHLRNVGVLS